MALLEFQDVSYTKDHECILKDLSVKINAGDYISIVGPSGSGKSTFLKLCCHLVSPTGGTIIYKGRDMMQYNPMELRKNIAYCFQTPYLFGDRVEENIAFPFEVRNLKVDMERVGELFLQFNLDPGFLKKEVKNLSGGEKQRIALIRTLLFKPETLLLDEVTSALDADNASIVENAIQAAHREGSTVLWITHSPEQSRKYANKVLSLENGEVKSLEVLR